MRQDQRNRRGAGVIIHQDQNFFSGGYDLLDPLRAEGMVQCSFDFLVRIRTGLNGGWPEYAD